MTPAKAEALARWGATNADAMQKVGNADKFFVLADDSGLEVDALNGAPGVFTRRFAGPDATDRQNYEKLLDTLRGLPRAQRGAAGNCNFHPSGE